MPEFVKTSVERSVATVHINRPQVHNAFDDVLMNDLTRAFEALGSNDGVRVVVLSSGGKSFSAGADIRWMKRMVGCSVDENIQDATILARMLRTIRECPKPVIARVHGATFGGGVGLVAAADLAVAVSSAIFCLSEVKLGIVPAVISPFLIEKIGPGAARRYALTAERFDAEEAKRIGLISEVLGSVDDLDPWIENICGFLKHNGPEALAACKQILSEVTGMSWDQVQARTAQCIAEVRVSAEGQEGLKAFLEKRKPNWTQ